MPNPKRDDKSEYINREENITKGNVSAKRVALYRYDAGADTLNPVNNLTPGTDFDYLSIANSDTDEDTLTFKTGGSGGSTVQTIVIGYAAGADKASDDISTLTWS